MIDPLAPAQAYLTQLEGFPIESDTLMHLRAVVAALEAERRAREIAQARLRAIADADADALTDQEFARRVRTIMKDG